METAVTQFVLSRPEILKQFVLSQAGNDKLEECELYLKGKVIECRLCEDKFVLQTLFTQKFRWQYCDECR